MILELGDQFFVDISDGYNYTLKRRGVASDRARPENVGRVIEKSCGFFTSLEAAVKKALCLGLCECQDLVEAKKLVLGINRTLAKAEEMTLALRTESKMARDEEGSANVIQQPAD